MSLIILNGSPKGKESNTDIFIRQFVKNMERPYEIKLVSNEKPDQLSEYIKGFDTVIVTMPLYIHAMPGPVLKLFEQMLPVELEGKSMGFIVQAGFIETEQQKYLIRYFEQLAARLHYSYLGTIQKGDAASISIFPSCFNKKLFFLLNKLGMIFEETGMFDNAILQSLRNPYSLTKTQTCLYQIAYKIGVNSLPWCIMQAKNHVYKVRLAKPFL